MSTPGKRSAYVAGLATTRAKRTKSTPRTTTPTLDAYLDGAGVEGPCGNFKRKRKWRLTNGRQGLIIQKVTRTFAVQSYDATTLTWAAINGATLDGYVTDPSSSVHATATQYWELWKVRASGDIVKNEDSFALCSLIPDPNTIANTTKGSFTITGEAYFYPTRTVTPDDLNFAEDALDVAGELFSRNTDPAGEITGHRLVSASGPVTYTVTATWDSTHIGVIPISTTPFIPPGAISVIT